MEGLKLLEQFAQSQRWETYQSGFADIVYSLKIGGATRKKGQRNFHLGYQASQIVGRSLDVTEVLACIADSVLKLGVIGVSEYTMFRANVIVRSVNTVLVVTDESLPQDVIVAEGELLEDQVCGLGEDGSMHLFPCPKRLLHNVSLIICPHSEVSEVRVLSSAELALRVMAAISQKGYSPVDAMSRIARLPKSLIGLECHPAMLPVLIRESFSGL